MERLSKKDKFNIFWICLIYLGIAFIITHGEYVFGSKTDWGFQHFVFPEYFRMLFYDTHDLFPDFAFNIGGGQNIYYFAYYGLLSPITLLSYLLPFIPMSFYIPCIMLLLGVFSICLFYIWIKGFKFSNKLNFLLTLMFALASPLLYHSHRHIMFVSYMPFLILGLIGVRRYFSKGYKGLMIISIFLMIMTSYYYSVGGIICLTLYGVYEYLKIHDKFVLKDFIKKGFNYALLVITGIMMAGMLLLPVVYTLMNGRGESLSGNSLFEALIPSINLDFILYDSYAVGLTGIALISVLYLIFKRKENRFLGISLSLLFIWPIFVYILNGALYLDGKALIPFLPLYVLGIGLFLKEVLSGKVNLKIVFLIIIFSLTFVYLNDKSFRLYYLIDSLIMIIAYLFYRKFNKDMIIVVILGILSFVVCLSENLSDNLILKDDFNKQNDLLVNEIMEDISKNDDGVFRTVINLKASNEIVNKVSHIDENLVTLYSSTYNTNYSDFFYDFNNNRASRNMFITSESGNTLFESYMGVKYLITDKKAPIGYSLFKDYGKYQVYINENTLPLGYFTDKIMSYDDYEKLNFPDDSLALIGNIIADSGNYKYESMAKKYELDLNDGEKSGLKLESYKDGYKVSVSDKGSIKFNLDDDKLYLLRFTLENPQKCSLGDTYIDINGIRNKLTCKSWKYFNSNYTFDYTLNGNLNIEFSKGVHYIKKIDFYSFDYDEFMENIDITLFENVKVSGDKISGNISVSGDGYFNLSIPYDEGFIIKVDGKKVDYEKVNKNFIGFPLSDGSHDIEIEFKVPNVFIGKVISLIGISIFIIIIIYERKLA